MRRGPKKFSIAESSNNFSCDHVNRTNCQMNNSPGVLNHTGLLLLLSSLGEHGEGATDDFGYKQALLQISDLEV